MAGKSVKAVVAPITEAATAYFDLVTGKTDTPF
jgi:hypothetical protein